MWFDNRICACAYAYIGGCGLTGSSRSVLNPCVHYPEQRGVPFSEVAIVIASSIGDMALGRCLEVARFSRGPLLEVSLYVCQSVICMLQQLYAHTLQHESS